MQCTKRVAQIAFCFALFVCGNHVPSEEELMDDSHVEDEDYEEFAEQTLDDIPETMDDYSHF
ncbi:hypothetical protein Ciccas_014349 [Cichlidogyrus casuarinus]|uniref:Uncharacterized protein n=1 Tax=Cichlidogyrus casuarinus TaxID=1844966 RepID=A0ABD2PIF0_9PLAT